MMLSYNYKYMQMYLIVLFALPKKSIKDNKV